MGAGTLALAVLEGCSTIRCPAHFEHAWGSLDALDSQTRPKATGSQIDIELAERLSVSVPVSRAESSPVPIELTSPRVGRHALLERVEEFIRALRWGDPSGEDVLARPSFAALPCLGPEPCLVGVNELLRAQHDPDLLYGHFKDVAFVDVCEAPNGIGQGQLSLWSEPDETHV
jgi:hypothetical protein